MNTLQKWIAAATLDELKTLAKLAGTTIGNIRQLSGGYRTEGQVRATPELARRLELASKDKRLRRPGLKPLRRVDLCPACGQCEFARRCGQE